MEFIVNCAWCESQKTAGPVWFSCGADYAENEAIKQHRQVLSDNASADLKNKSAPDLAIDASHNVLETEDRAFEKKLFIIFIPAMLVASLLVQL